MKLNMIDVFQVSQKLIDLGASLKIRCRWTNMAPLHYAAYFDVAPVLNTLLKASKVCIYVEVFSAIFIFRATKD